MVVQRHISCKELFLGDEMEKKRTGPKPDRVKLPGNWEDAIKQALTKKPAKSNSKKTKKSK
jgi:hypothetical protein